MNLYNLKPGFQKFLQPLAQKLVSIGLGPNAATIGGVIAAFLAAFIFYLSSDNSSLLFLAPPLLFVRIICNALDGMLARAITSTDHAFGEIINELADRVSDIIIFVGILLTGYADVLLVFFVTTLTLLTSYIGTLSKSVGGTRRYEGPMGKADRMFYLSVMAIIIATTSNYVYANYALFFIAIGLSLTTLRRLYKVYSEFKS